MRPAPATGSSSDSAALDRIRASHLELDAPALTSFFPPQHPGQSSSLFASFVRYCASSAGLCDDAGPVDASNSRLIIFLFLRFLSSRLLPLRWQTLPATLPKPCHHSRAGRPSATLPAASKSRPSSFLTFSFIYFDPNLTQDRHQPVPRDFTSPLSLSLTTCHPTWSHSLYQATMSPRTHTRRRDRARLCHLRSAHTRSPRLTTQLRSVSAHRAARRERRC